MFNNLFRDDVAHVDNKYISHSYTLDMIQKITNFMNETIPDVPIIPVLGNHDAFPHNQFPDDPENDLYQKTAEMWKNMGWTEDAYTQYKENGGFYTTEIQPLMLIGIIPLKKSRQCKFSFFVFSRIFKNQFNVKLNQSLIF